MFSKNPVRILVLIHFLVEKMNFFLKFVKKMLNSRLVSNGFYAIWRMLFDVKPKKTEQNARIAYIYPLTPYGDEFMSFISYIYIYHLD